MPIGRISGYTDRNWLRPIRTVFSKGAFWSDPRYALLPIGALTQNIELRNATTVVSLGSNGFVSVEDSYVEERVRFKGDHDGNCNA
jgi:hypothetical protein